MFPNIPVSVKFVNTNTWPIQLTHLFGDNDVDLIKKEMNRATFSSEEVSAVVFLKSLRGFKAEDVFDIYKQFTATKIDKNVIIQFAKINKLDLKLIKAFLKYKPSTDGKEVMQKYGIKGPQVGEKIKEIEAEKFKETI